MLVVLTIGFTAFANAQTAPTHRATIPFDFIVGDKTFKAGEYTVNFGVSAANKEHLLLRSVDGKQTAILNPTASENGNEAVKQANFVFYVADEHYYLAGINTAQKSVEIRNPHSKRMAKAKKYGLAPAS